MPPRKTFCDACPLFHWEAVHESYCGLGYPVTNLSGNPFKGFQSDACGLQYIYCDGKEYRPKMRPITEQETVTSEVQRG